MSLWARRGERWARVGERCLCGRPALVVYEDPAFGPTSDCGREEAHPPEHGACGFCGDSVDHARYWVAEVGVGRDAAAPEGEPQAGRCPRYRLDEHAARPLVHAGSVVPFDPVADRITRAPHRLQAELLAVCEEATGSPPGPHIGRLPAQKVAIRCRELAEIALAVPRGGDDRVAILAMLAELRALLTETGTPSEVVALCGPTALLRVSPDWDATHPLDRPLLVVRRGVRRLLTPDVPLRLYRTWWR